MPGTVGFIGLGSMGRKMAGNVLAGGFPLQVFDLRVSACTELVQRGARAAENVREIARNCNRIILCLPDRAAVDSVLFGPEGMGDALRSGQIIIDCGTTHPAFTRQVAAELAKLDVSFLDAPVTGMPPRAESGTLTLMVGGDALAFDQALPVLNAVGEVIVHMGPSGHGQLTKIVNNVLYNISVAAMAEMLPLAKRLGLDPEKVREVVSTGSGQSSGFDAFAALVLRGEFDRGYAMASAYKDMVAVMEQADEQLVPLPVASAAMLTYKMALAEGFGHQSKGAMVKVWERVAGVEARADA